MTAILSVAELTTAIKSQLESRFSTVAVRGEVSNLKEQSSGHLYFTLKDKEAQLSTVLFKGSQRLLSRPPKEGDQIVVKGEISVYAPRGAYQLIAREITYQGTGQLLLKLHELKKELASRGWFDSSLKKTLPKYPKTIGVVTSATGAVIQDILTVLERRFSGIHLLLFPVKVQGDGAAQEIAQAIHQFNQHRLADVLIVGRGGGSLEDLWAFNEECVARAIWESKIPVISAVGHETDVSLSDFAADVRAPTPSAAAEMVIGEKTQQLHFLTQTHQRLTQGLRGRLSHHQKLIERLQKHPALSSPYPLLGTPLQRLDSLKSELEQRTRHKIQQEHLKLLAMRKQAGALKPSTQLQTCRAKLTSLTRALEGALKQKMEGLQRAFPLKPLHQQLQDQVVRLRKEKKQRFEQLVSHLEAIDPKNLLTKGYCILFHENKESVILSVKELAAGDPLKIRLHDGTLLATLNEILP